MEKGGKTKRSVIFLVIFKGAPIFELLKVENEFCDQKTTKFAI